MASDQDLSGKDLLKSIKDKGSSEQSKIDQEKLRQVKEKIVNILPELKSEFKNEIPFSAIKERTEDVQTRRRDLRSIQQFGEVNPHSNYCFGFINEKRHFGFY